MTKSELIRSLVQGFDLPLRRATLVVDLLFEIISEGLEQGEKVEIRGFGSFSPKLAKPRLSRNPQTGEEIRVGERRSLGFKVGRGLHAKLNAELNAES